MFALRNGVSPGDYDLLSTNRFLAIRCSPTARVDVGNAGDEWLLGDGWHAPEREGPRHIPLGGAAGDMLIPLDHAATLRVQVRLHAFAFPVHQRRR